ncbi:hypothetical protein [Marinobacter sp.]|uniref:hypothetical protein n=1 Tax=Marinobacter sp. TaxID=50741 RepID=UPI00384E2EDA
MAGNRTDHGMRQHDGDSEAGPERKIMEFLSRPDSYPEGTGRVEIRETHLSRVYLTDRFVYKLKKPLRYDFLDFTTPEARLHNCETEVLINSELAPDVYQGVVTLAENAREGLNLEGRGRPLDYLVKMRRLPEDRNLEVQMAEGHLDPKDIDRAARRLAHFYAERPVHGPVQAEKLEKKVGEHAAELRGLPVDTGGRLDKLERGLLARLEDHRQDLASRRRVDVHGDLRPEHVYPGEKPAFLDRLEFDAGLRLMDPLEELCFFAMECRRQGNAWVGERFIEVYQQVTGDSAPDSLVAIYTGYRALLWSLLKARHLERNDHRKPWGDKARQYLDLGLQALGQAEDQAS